MFSFEVRTKRQGATRFNAKKPKVLALLCDLKQAASLLWATNKILIMLILAKDLEG